MDVRKLGSDFNRMKQLAHAADNSKLNNTYLFI